jgi:hypothetical protein
MTTSKLRLNTDIRKKIGGLILSHFENEKTTELENFVSAKEDITTAYNRAFKIATAIVSRAYPKDDVATLQSFKKKYGRACDVVAKDSCFYFANAEMKKQKKMMTMLLNILISHWTQICLDDLTVWILATHTLEMN